MNDKTIETRVVGVTFNGRQAVVAQLSVGERVWLRREPHNPHDPNAIRVQRHTGQQIGYLSRTLAADLARRFDAHGKPIPALITSLPGGYAPYVALGVRIKFTMPRARPRGRSLAWMLAQGYHFGAPTWEAEEIDAQVAQSLKCRKCDGSMRYQGYHNHTEYIALAICCHCGREVAF